MRLVRIHQVIGLQDALDAAGGGGGSETFDEVLANGSTLTADREVTLAGHAFTVGDGSGRLSVSKTTIFADAYSPSELNDGQFNAYAEDTEAGFGVSAHFNGAYVGVQGAINGTGSSIGYAADTHAFTGRLNIQDVPEYADLAAAIADGLVDWDVWRIGGDLKIVVPGI